MRLCYRRELRALESAAVHHRQLSPAVTGVLLSLAACGPTTLTSPRDDVRELGAAGAAVSDDKTGVNGLVSTAKPQVCPPPYPSHVVDIAHGRLFARGSLNFQSPGAAFDGDRTTSTGSSTEDGILAMQFGSERTLYRSVVHFEGDPPQRYKLQKSDDARDWVDILRVNNPNLDDERVLPAVGATYLRLLVYRDVGADQEPNESSAISELEVFDRDAGDRPPGCGAIIYPAIVDRTSWVASTNAGEIMPRAVVAQDQGFVDAHGGIESSPPWLNGGKLRVGSYVAIDMKEAQTFNQLHAEAEHDAMLDYQLFGSDDGLTWGAAISSGVLVAAGGDGFAPINFTRLSRRYFKLESRYDSEQSWWRLKTISLLDTRGATPPDEGDGIDFAWGKSTDGSLVKNAGALFDGNPATGVDDAGVVQVDLGTGLPIAKINVGFDSTVGSFRYRVETSNDRIVWAKRQAVTNSYVVPHRFEATIAANYTCRYLRFSFEPSHLGSEDVPQRVNEIEVFRSVNPRGVGREVL
jgi:hypothetical protein